MSTRTRTAALVALVATTSFLLVACGGDGGDGGIPEDAGFDAADVRFAARMVPHHEQALVLVDIADGRDLSPAVADLVERIGAAQAPEVEEMQAWLEDWAAASLDDDGDDESDDDGDGLMGGVMGDGLGDGMEDHMAGGGMTGMPGMASPAQLAALEARAAGPSSGCGRR